jgi:hypothetical protein
MLVITPLKQLTLYIYIISHYSSFLKQNFEFTCSLAAMTFITPPPLCLTDVSSQLLEQPQELKEQVDAPAAAREQVNSKLMKIKRQ